MYDDHDLISSVTLDNLFCTEVILSLLNLSVIVGMLLEDPQNQELYDYVNEEYEKTGIARIVSIMRKSPKYSSGMEGIEGLKRLSNRVHVALLNDDANRSYIWKKTGGAVQ